ncbi:MAG: molybdate ABC transporter substrate-binding protein [Pirellulales bacterium]
MTLKTRMRRNGPTRTGMAAVGLCVLLAVFAACKEKTVGFTHSASSTTNSVAADSSESSESASAPSVPSVVVSDRVLTISVATSTKDVVEQLVAEFSRDTGVRVAVNAGSSSSLAAQIEAGAPVDIFLSASRNWAESVVKKRATSESRSLLSNRLVLVVPAGNPGKVQQPSDLASERVTRLALAGEKVPAGVYAGQALTRLGLLETLEKNGKIARGLDVRATLGFVERGEAEAGIVYATDVRGVATVETVHTFDSALHEPIDYVLVLLKDDAGEDPTDSKRLFDFLVSPRAQAEYHRYGYSFVAAPPGVASE